jgi:hypothetical protein
MTASDRPKHINSTTMAELTTNSTTIKPNEEEDEIVANLTIIKPNEEEDKILSMDLFKIDDMFAKLKLKR